MNKETFDGIAEKFDGILEECDGRLGSIKTQDDILRLPLKDIQSLKAFCRAEQSRQDKIFQEVRHLIGMGNLTPVQTQALCKRFREYSAYRSDIKTIAGHLSSIDDIPGLPSKSIYKLSVLGDITLESELRSEEAVKTVYREGAEETAEPKSASATTASETAFEYVPSYLSGVAVKYGEANARELVKEINKSKASEKAERKLAEKILSVGAHIKNSTSEAIISKTGDDYYLYMDMTTSQGRKFANRLIRHMRQKKSIDMGEISGRPLYVWES